MPSTENRSTTHPKGAAPTADTPVARAAARLIAAAESHQPCLPVRDEIGPDDVNAAYAVQQQLHRHALGRNRQVSGRKIGLTAPAVQAQLGVDQPDFGFIYHDMDVTQAGVDLRRLLQPKIEAEVAFVLGADLDHPDDTADPATVAAAVVDVLPALEIVDSRIAGWDISFADTVADNASSGLYVLGADRRAPAHFGTDLGGLGDALAALTMTMTRTDATGQSTQISTGRGADCLGSPLNALAWLATAALRHGEPLRAGQVVLAGALGPMAPVNPGDTYTAEFPGLGTVTTHFTTPTGQSSEVQS